MDVRRSYGTTAKFQVSGIDAIANMSSGENSVKDAHADIFIRLTDVTLRFSKYHNPSPALKEAIILGLSRKREKAFAKENFLALNKINLEIRGGERVGIIGLNGAGKSTLLKTIVGIYSPQEGQISVRGNVTPLIELGTGFDPEQSGRENIYLNGAMLGRGRAQMRAYEDQIIDFAELRESIDQPIKYYSSGMMGRLAYAIGTMLDPEILLIDEVFSTGDARFVNKAMDRMAHLLNNSKIVVMVSHNIDQVKQLCNRIILLDHGQIIKDGSPEDVAEFYEEEIVGTTTRKRFGARSRSADDNDPKEETVALIEKLGSNKLSDPMSFEIQYIQRSKLNNVESIRCPLVLIAGLPFTGGNYLARLFDGHSQCHVFGSRLAIGKTVALASNRKFAWPEFDLEEDPKIWWEKLYEKTINRQFKEGFAGLKPDGESPITVPFLLMPSLMKKMFFEMLQYGEVLCSRQILNRYMSSYFNSWLDYKGLYKPSKYVVAFAGNVHMEEGYVDAFFRDYPDGQVIVVTREHASWLAAAQSEHPQKYANEEWFTEICRQSLANASKTVQNHPERVTMVGLEALVSNTRGVMSVLCNKLDLAFEECLLEPTFNGIAIAEEDFMSVLKHIANKQANTLAANAADSLQHSAPIV